MDPWFQNLVSLLVVGLAAVYLLRRGRRFYLSLKMKSGSRCGGCSSCGTGPVRPTVAGARRDGRNAAGMTKDE